MKVLDIVDSINLFARLEIVFGSLWHRRAAHEIRVSRYGNVSGVQASAALRKRGIRVWGERTTSDWFVLHVSPQQAKWAESVLLTAGCNLERLTQGAKAFARMPTPWGEQDKRKKGQAHDRAK